MFVLVFSVRWSVSHAPTGWPHDHGLTNVGAMVKTKYSLIPSIAKKEGVGGGFQPLPKSVEHFFFKSYISAKCQGGGGGRGDIGPY